MGPSGEKGAKEVSMGEATAGNVVTVANVAVAGMVVAATDIVDQYQPLSIVVSTTIAIEMVVCASLNLFKISF